MSKRKASYNLTFKLKAVKSTEEKTKEAAAREFNVDPRRFLVSICVFIRGGLLQHSFDRSPGIDKILITAQRNKFSLFNASLN